MKKYIKTEYLKFNSSENYVKLDDKFIFAFRHFDGFSNRLLNFDLYVDKEYNFVCHLNSFSKSVLNNDYGFNFLIESSLPIEIKHPLSILINDNFDNIKNEYKAETFAATDMGSKHLFYKLKGETKSINIYDNLLNSPEEFLTKNEKRLQKLNRLIMDWMENFFKLIVKE